jgi:hypothetical protein
MMMQRFWEKSVVAALKAGMTAHCAIAFADAAVLALAERAGGVGNEDSQFIASIRAL